MTTTGSAMCEVPLLFGGTSHINAATTLTSDTRIVDVPHPNNDREQQQRLVAQCVRCRHLFGGTSHINAARMLVAATPSLRGRSPSRAKLPFDCSVSDGEDEPGSPFAKPQVHEASSIALTACHCCRYWPRAKHLLFRQFLCFFQMVHRNRT